MRYTSAAPILAACAAVSAAPIGFPPYHGVSELQNVLVNTHNSDAYSYPTDLTRNIVPKPIHSHNDEWRDIPFYTALAAGCTSVEADVHYINDTLFVGHEVSALTPSRTLDSLYLNPILSVLERQNPDVSPYIGDKPPSHINGVFDTVSSQTLYLFIDIKTSDPSTYPALLSALETFLSKSYLTTHDGTSLHPGPVTVIFTGDVPLDSLSASPYPHYTFYDAPLSSLPDDTSPSLSITASTSLLESVGYPAYGSQGFSEPQLEILATQIAKAREMGIGARYWDTPAWPIGTRNMVWRTLVDLGVQFLNADDLSAAAGGDW